MKFLTPSILSSAILAQPDTFDFHDVVNRILTVNPCEYARELYERVGKADPIHETHMVIGAALADIPGIRKNGRKLTRNIRGEICENQGWQKAALAAAVI